MGWCTVCLPRPHLRRSGRDSVSFALREMLHLSMTSPQTQSTITCPRCAHREMMTMPTNACLVVHECTDLAAPIAATTAGLPAVTQGWGMVPLPGLTVKLVPVEDRYEVRVRGPNVTPGYWRQPELTAKAFDDEGYYKFGDALKFVDPADVRKGLLFDGRVAEDFKLATGTWVNTDAIRLAVIAAFICVALALAKISAGAPCDNWVASVFDAPKL